MAPAKPQRPKIPRVLMKSIIVDPEPDVERQERQIDQLKQAVRAQKVQIAAVKKKFAKSKKKSEANSVPAQYVMGLRAMEFFYGELSNEIHEFEVSGLEAIVERLKLMIKTVKKSALFKVDVQSFIQQLLDNCAQNVDYLMNKRRKRSIANKMERFISRHPHPNYLNLLKNELLIAGQNYDPEIQYCPPSDFDTLIIEYLLHSPLRDMVEPTVLIIAEGDPSAAISIIGEFTITLYDNLKITTENTQSIVYTSLVRFLFDQAYSKNPELNYYKKQNALFMERCHEYSQSKVQDLGLVNSITKKFVRGLPVFSIIKQKHVDMVRQMEWMTNPIDLMKHVHTILGSLADYFGKEEGFLSFDDTLTLILCLMSISRPTNAVAIAKFLDKWTDVQLSTIVSVAKNYFIAAIEQLLTEEELRDTE